jgi:hypothetical protein
VNFRLDGLQLLGHFQAHLPEPGKIQPDAVEFHLGQDLD